MTVTDQEQLAAFLLRMRGQGLSNKALFSAIEAIPRRDFVPRSFQQAAFSDRMIPIDCGETIEGLDLQARVLAALDVEPGHRVLEVGTGSGYSAAVLSRLAARITTVERFRRLAEQARERHRELGLENVTVHFANGREGYREDGPYDRVVFWAAFESLPRNSVDWLATNGIMIAPIGPAEGEQQLEKLTKIGSRFEREDLGSVRFQPLAETVAAKL